MAATYTIKITAVRVTTEAALVDVVKAIEYTVTGTDSGCTFTLHNTLQFTGADPEDFTPYADLTEPQMVSWIEQDATALEPIKAHIAYVLEKEVAKAALESKPLPWAPAPEAPDPALLPSPASPD